MYGGLGKVGLDHQGGNGDGAEEEEELAPGFSTSAIKYVQYLMKEPSECDEFLLDGNEHEEELNKIDEKFIEEEEEKSEEVKDGDVNFDRPLYKKVPDNDERYRQILFDRFGHEEFKEGQLEALKILLEKR